VVLLLSYSVFGVLALLIPPAQQNCYYANRCFYDFAILFTTLYIVLRFCLSYAIFLLLLLPNLVSNKDTVAQKRHFPVTACNVNKQHEMIDYAWQRQQTATNVV
jgi:hypothetical protein